MSKIEDIMKARKSVCLLKTYNTKLTSQNTSILLVFLVLLKIEIKNLYNDRRKCRKTLTNSLYQTHESDAKEI